MTLVSRQIKALSFKVVVSLVLFLIYCHYVFQTAWLSDDALISMRAVLNFTHGYGPVFNVGERVQAFTHPLWFFLLSIFNLVSNNWLLVPIYLSIFISLLTFALYLKYNFNNTFALITGGVILICSKTYIDFSTSGLENPLSHLLLFLLVIIGNKCIYSEEKRLTSLFLFFFTCSLLFLTRQDLAALILPYTLYVCFYSKLSFKNIVCAFLVGTLPASLWEIFSIIYYGFPFPNTYYAKLYSAIPHKVYYKHGLDYYVLTFLFDPFLIAALFFMLIIPIKNCTYNLALTLGCMIYMAYIIYIGGDFMAGRMFTPVLFILCMKLHEANIYDNYASTIIQLLLITVLGIGNVYNQRPGLFFQGHGRYVFCDNNTQVCDERNFWKYYGRDLYNLLAYAKRDVVSNPWIYSGNKNITTYKKGSQALNMINDGPDTYVIDALALSNPLLARLPSFGKFRTGHLERKIPSGYIESLKEGDNRIINQEISEFNDHIVRVTRGSLFTLKRLKSIIYLNLFKKKLSDEIISQPDY